MGDSCRSRLTHTNQKYVSFLLSANVSCEAHTATPKVVGWMVKRELAVGISFVVAIAAGRPSKKYLARCEMVPL